MCYRQKFKNIRKCSVARVTDNINIKNEKSEKAKHAQIGHKDTHKEVPVLKHKIINAYSGIGDKIRALHQHYVSR